MAMMLEIGETPSFLQMVSATGATMSTVATLSTKAEMIPAKRESETMAHMTLGVFSMMMSARSDGILESIKSDTNPMVPAIMKMTFQSMVVSTSLSGMIPSTTNSVAEVTAIFALCLGRVRSST